MMKVDKLRKEKSPQVKPVAFKKTESKKTISKKEEGNVAKGSLGTTKTIAFSNGHSKNSTGFSTGTQSSKQFNPSAVSFKNSPKASLGEMKSPPPKEGRGKKV